MLPFRFLLAILAIFWFTACNDNDELQDCLINDLSVSVGDCTSQHMYSVIIDFNYSNIGNNDFFELYVRDNVLIGYYPLSSLPLTLDSFQMSGLNEDFIKVCINDAPDCCDVIEFSPPDCQENNDPCNVRDLTVSNIDCNEDGTYNFTLDFIHENAGNQFFEVFIGNNVLFGYYSLADLPVVIENFSPRPNNDYDFIKVCINDVPDCCMAFEFMQPDCQENNDPCEVRDLTVSNIDCNEDGTYNFTLDLIHENAGNQFFEVFIGNNVLFGYYSLADLPVVIENFSPRPNNDYDFIKVCINDVPDCCMALEFMQPNC